MQLTQAITSRSTDQVSGWLPVDRSQVEVVKKITASYSLKLTALPGPHCRRLTGSPITRGNQALELSAQD